MPDQIIATTTKTTPKRYRCRHIFTDGHRCGSPSLRGEPFCYYHHTTRGFADEKRHRRSWTEFELPPLEDRSSVLAAITEVLQRIAFGNLPTKQAGLLLYGLQIASLNLPKTDEIKPENQKAQEAQPVEEVITDPRFGDLAPIAEIIVLDSGTWASPPQTQPEENPSLEQEQNRVPHLRGGLIVAKVGEAEQTHPETTKAQPTHPGASSPALSLPKRPTLEDLGGAPPTPTEPEPPQPITLPTLHASISANGATHTSLGRTGVPGGRFLPAGVGEPQGPIASEPEG